jgi:hypothetical protein
MAKAKERAKSKPSNSKVKASAKPAAKQSKPAKPPKAAKPVLKAVKAPPPVAAAPAKAAGKGKATAAAAASAPAPAPAKATGKGKEKKSLVRATKLPPMGEPLTKREMEQLLTAGAGRGVEGEGSLKGRLVMTDGLPHLIVNGLDKRELTFLLQGPDQEVLPAYVDHKVSVSGRIRKTTNYLGVVDVRKYTAKKPDQEVAPVVEEKLKFLSPGEIVQISSAGMGAGMKGFATIRGSLEMTGEEYFLVVSNAGTRHQVSFALEGKAIAKSLRKIVGMTVQVIGVVEKSSGWGGKLVAETIEPRGSDLGAVSRENLDTVTIDAGAGEKPVEIRMNQGLAVRLVERPGFIWAIEPTMAKRVGLREANFEFAPSGATREFFFTPRNPGVFEVEFFLAKAFLPAQVSKIFKLQLTVNP